MKKWSLAHLFMQEGVDQGAGEGAFDELGYSVHGVVAFRIRERGVEPVGAGDLEDVPQLGNRH